MPTSYVISRHGVSTHTPEHPHPGVRSSIRICWDVPDDTVIELSHEGQATTATVSLADLRAYLVQREIDLFVTSGPSSLGLVAR